MFQCYNQVIVWKPAERLPEPKGSRFVSVEPAPTPQERRLFRRAATRRVGRFSSPFSDRLASALIVDVSLNGLQLHTRQPVDKGTIIEIEMDGGETAATTLLRGEVVRVHPMPNGKTALGVRIRPRLPFRRNPPNAATRAQIREVLDRLETELKSHAREEVQTEPGIPVALEVAGKAPRWRRAAGVLLTLVAAALLLALLYERLVENTVLLVPGRSGDLVSPSPAAAATPSRQMVEIPLDLDDPFSLRDTAAPADALAGFEARLRAELPPPLRTYTVLGMAETLAASGRVPEARALLQSTSPDLAPPPWADALVSLRQELEGDTLAPGTLVHHRWLPALAFTVPSEDRQHTPGSAEENVLPADVVPSTPKTEIIISTSQFTLTLRHGGTVHRVYPVGLGAQHSTPLGEFRIVNRIKDPVWYNRGRPVAPGSPDNPLGKFWLGLADASGPLPVGIHPTDAAESIGAAQSRGCIRMRPDDAADLFEHCPVGTTVRIEP